MKIVRLGWWKLEDDIHLCCTCVCLLVWDIVRSPNMVWQIVHEHISADSLGYHKHKTDHKTKRKYSEQDATGNEMEMELTERPKWKKKAERQKGGKKKSVFILPLASTGLSVLIRMKLGIEYNQKIVSSTTHTHMAIWWC